MIYRKYDFIGGHKDSFKSVLLAFYLSKLSLMMFFKSSSLACVYYSEIKSHFNYFFFFFLPAIDSAMATACFCFALVGVIPSFLAIVEIAFARVFQGFSVMSLEIFLEIVLGDFPLEIGMIKKVRSYFFGFTFFSTGFTVFGVTSGRKSSSG